MIAIVDYGAGNIRSVENALKRLGAPYALTSDAEVIRRADHVVLPGVGEASSAMAALSASGLDTLLKSLTQPVLGICIGLQLLCSFSEEGGTDCLGIFQPRVVRFPSCPGVKIPHTGWDTVGGLRGPLFKGVPDGSFVYYVHSYCPALSAAQTIAVTEYAGVSFSAALQKDNFFGTQFHPEKSGPVGAAILKNFIEL